jgi:thioredoxin reductase (NADPH)
MNKRVLLGVVLTLLSLSSCITIGQDKERRDYKVVIVGSGAAGLTAGIYLGRAGIDTLIIEGDTPGGLLTETPEIGNWPGIKSISGDELMQRIHDHAAHEGCHFLSDLVASVDFSKKPYQLTMHGGETYTAKAVIVATGAKRKEIGCPGEREYWGQGVSACATCDAHFYREKTAVVVGGGRTALTEAHHLARFAKKVIVIHRSASFRVTDPIKDKVENDPKIQAIHSSMVKEIVGDQSGVTGITIESKIDGKVTTIPTDGVFVAIGFSPNVAMFGGQLALDELGFIKVIDGTKTSIDGVFAAGDVSHRRWQQVIVAAGDGCKSALDCTEYFEQN